MTFPVSTMTQIWNPGMEVYLLGTMYPVTIFVTGAKAPAVTTLQRTFDY